MSGLRVLVVDDNEEFCENLAEILTLEQYIADTAYDALLGLLNDITDQRATGIIIKP